jgi:hypothetical protein
MPSAGAPLPGSRFLSPPSHQAQRSSRFGLLLLLLIASYLLSVFTRSAWVVAAQVALFVGVVVLAARTGQVRRRIAVPALSVVTGGSVLFVALVLAHPSAEVLGAANAWKAAILALAVVLIVGRVIAQPEVTLQSLYGAVSAYLVIGLMFTACYAAMDNFGGGDFFANGSPGNLQTFQYFSFTTLTTLGYGDFTAAQSGGRAIAVMEALLGQVFLATLVARLVSAFPGTGRGERGGQSRAQGDDDSDPR